MTLLIKMTPVNSISLLTLPSPIIVDKTCAAKLDLFVDEGAYRELSPHRDDELNVQHSVIL